MIKGWARHIIRLSVGGVVPAALLTLSTLSLAGCADYRARQRLDHLERTLIMNINLSNANAARLDMMEATRK